MVGGGGDWTQRPPDPANVSARLAVSDDADVVAHPIARAVDACGMP